MARPKRAYVIDKQGKCICFTSDHDTCIVASLVSARTESAFHDAALAQCTKEMDALLSKARKTNKENHRELAFLITPEGLLLAWVEHGIGAHDDEREINRALHINTRKR